MPIHNNTWELILAFSTVNLDAFLCILSINQSLYGQTPLLYFSCMNRIRVKEGTICQEVIKDIIVAMAMTVLTLVDLGYHF